MSADEGSAFRRDHMLLMKGSVAVKILNWQTEPLLKGMLLFFLLFLALNSYLKDIKQTFLPLISFFNCDLIARVLKTHFNDFIIFFFHEQDSFAEDSFTIHSTEYHTVMSTKCNH